MFNQPCIDRYGNDQCHLRRFNLEDAPSRRTIPGIKPTPSSRPAIPPIPDRPRVAVTYVPGTAPSQPEQERTGQVVSGRIKPTIKTTPMTSEEFNAAAMSRAAYIQFQEGERATMRYAKQNVKGGWVYDPVLSNEMAVVFSRGDEAAIAYRGTQESPGFNKDWEANFRKVKRLP